MRFPKVLVCAPQSDRKNYCFDDWLKSAQTLNYPNYDIFLADNSSTKKNYKDLIKRGIKAHYVKPKGKDTITLIGESHEVCRKYALEHGYDYILHLETDVFPPRDIIHALLFEEKAVISAMYYIDFGEKSKLMIQLPDERGQTVGFTHQLDETDLNFVDGSVKQVFHAGLGCCLIRRDILEKIKFRSIKGMNLHPDSFFAQDLYEMGIKNFVHTGELCEHRNSNSHY